MENVFLECTAESSIGHFHNNFIKDKSYLVEKVAGIPVIESESGTKYPVTVRASSCELVDMDVLFEFKPSFTIK